MAPAAWYHAVFSEHTATMDHSYLTLRAALAEDRLEEFVRQEEARGAELSIGSDFERGLALMLVQQGARAPADINALTEHQQ
jgi:hypothetical protein